VSLKIFQIFLVALVAIFTFAGLLFLITGIASLAPTLISGSGGISSVSGGVSGRVLDLIVTVAVLMVVGLFVAWRWLKSGG
jgi:hypothetical protein